MRSLVAMDVIYMLGWPLSDHRRGDGASLAPKTRYMRERGKKVGLPRRGGEGAVPNR